MLAGMDAPAHSVTASVDDARLSPADIAHLYQDRTRREMDRLLEIGLVSPRTHRWHMFFWTWATPRYGGAAGERQLLALRRFGEARLLRRACRVRAFMAHARRLALAPTLATTRTSVALLTFRHRTSSTALPPRRRTRRSQG